MKDTLRLHLLVFSLAFIGCSAGCDVNGRQKRVTATQPSVLQGAESGSGATNPSQTVRFELQHIKAPEPGSNGTFVDERHAWITDELTLRGDTVEKSRGLARTTDGGRTWIRLRPPAKTNPLDWFEHYSWHITFISPTRCWLAGNDSTWKTDDGGLTWQRIFSASFDDLQFGDVQHGWMNIADKSGQQSYVTEDGGDKWQPCGPKRDYSNQVPGQHSYFVTSQIGWSITSRADKRDSRITTKGVATTKDGGCNWEQLWVDSNRDARYYDIYFVDQFKGWLAGEMHLLNTSDGGKTWLEVPRPRTDANVLSVHFLNSKEDWIIAGYSSMRSEETGVYRTTDGGNTWRQLSESELLDGLTESGKQIEIPSKWRPGKLLQMLFSRRAKEHEK